MTSWPDRIALALAMDSISCGVVPLHAPPCPKHGVTRLDAIASRVEAIASRFLSEDRVVVKELEDEWPQFVILTYGHLQHVWFAFLPDYFQELLPVIKSRKLICFLEMHPNHATFHG